MELATGATIGGVISSNIIGFELFGGARWFDRRGRRLPLLAAMLLRTFLYSARYVSTSRHPKPFTRSAGRSGPSQVR